jgi:hypothetical protein
MIVTRKKDKYMKINSVDGVAYDGVFFFPAVDDDGDDATAYNFWSFTGKFADKKSVEATEVGNKFHVAFFREDNEKGFMIDDIFEAIFADPKVYLEGLNGSNLFGVLCRKTEISKEWFESYLEETSKKLNIVNEHLKS